MPFQGLVRYPGLASLYAAQNGEPIEGAEIELYRVNRYGGEDTLIGTYKTNQNGIATASHLTYGEYYWQDPSWVVKEEFRITGTDFVKSEIDLPMTLSRTITFLDQEITIETDLSGGYMAEINSYGTLYLYDRLGTDTQICNGFVLDQEEYEIRVEECKAYETYSEEDGLIIASEPGEYGSYYTCLMPVSKGVYYMLALFSNADVEDVLSRVTVTGPAPVLTGDDYLGTWAVGKGTMTITKGGEEGSYDVNVIWRNSAAEVSEWNYVCYFDGQSLYSLELGIRQDLTFGENDELVSTEIVFENGATNLTIGEDGRLTWIDFMTYPTEEAPVLEKVA